MPSQRQMRTLVVGVLIGVVFVLIYTSHIRRNEITDTRTIQDFYHKTMHGLEHNQPVSGGNNEAKDKDADGDIDADDEKLAKEMADRLKTAADQAKDSANKKAPLKPDPPSEVVGIGNSAAGQEKKKAVPAVQKDTEVDDDDDDDDDDKTSAEDTKAVEAELNDILKRSPVIIFSKTYCPFSKKTKAILLDKYAIQPAPHVVELDEHRLGPKLQAYLGKKTGRTTVPNVLVNSVSIGGNDDITELHARHVLAQKIVGLGQKRVQVQERAPKEH